MSSARSIARLTILAAVLLTGCNTMRREVIVSAHHPASPDAPEAPLPPDSTTLSVAPSASPVGTNAAAPAHGPHQHAPAAGATPAASDLRR